MTQKKQAPYVVHSVRSNKWLEILWLQDSDSSHAASHAGSLTLPGKYYYYYSTNKPYTQLKVHLGPHRCCYTNYIHLLWDTIRVWEPLTYGFYIDNLIRGKEKVFLPLQITILNASVPLINQYHSLRKKRIKALTHFIRTFKTGCPTVTLQDSLHLWNITLFDNYFSHGLLDQYAHQNRSNYLISHNSLGKENYHHSFMRSTNWNVGQKLPEFSESKTVSFTTGNCYKIYVSQFKASQKRHLPSQLCICSTVRSLQ
jgi:hypothetical protein